MLRESNCRLLNRHVLNNPFKHTAHLHSESFLLQFAEKWSPPAGACWDRKGEVGAEGWGKGRNIVNMHQNSCNAFKKVFLFN